MRQAMLVIPISTANRLCCRPEAFVPLVSMAKVSGYGGSVALPYLASASCTAIDISLSANP